MARFRNGDTEAAGELVTVLYPELRRLAAAKMRRERAEHTWQPTLLVNELYLALLKVKTRGEGGLSPEEEKAAFLGLAGLLMKRLLIEHARLLCRRVEKIEFREWPDVAEAGVESLHQVEEALDRLARIDPKFRTVVEMRVFEGMTGDEIARTLCCSPRSVATHWNFAKYWLEKELAG